MFPRQFPSVSTSPSAGAPGSSTTGSSSIGFAAVSMQAFGEQLGTPPLASVSHAYCEPSGQAHAPPGPGAPDARSIGPSQRPPCIHTPLQGSPPSPPVHLPFTSTAPITFAPADPRNNTTPTH